MTRHRDRPPLWVYYLETSFSKSTRLFVAAPNRLEALRRLFGPDVKPSARPGMFGVEGVPEHWSRALLEPGVVFEVPPSWRYRSKGEGPRARRRRLQYPWPSWRPPADAEEAANWNNSNLIPTTDRPMARGAR